MALQWSSPPVEILQSIFLRTICPRFLLDASTNRLAGLPTSPALVMATKTKLSLLKVCRSWHDVAVDFLYEDVVLLRMEHIPALLRTLDTTPGYRKLIKGVTINMFVKPRYGASFTRYVQRIIDVCPSLRRFETLSLLDLPDTVTYPRLDSVTELCIMMTTPDLIHLLDTTFNNLRFLSLTFPENETRLQPFDVEQPFYLPELETFLLQVEYPDKLRYHRFNPRLFDLLDAPRLQRFTCIFDGLEKFEGALTLFLRRNGCNLSFLHIGGPLDDECPASTFQNFLAECPVLEHVRLKLKRSVLAITHPHVEWLDIDSSIGNIWTLSSAKDSFPILQGLRTIVSPHFTYQRSTPVVPLIPREFVMHKNDTYELEFPGISLRHDQGVVYVEANNFLKNWSIRDGDSGSERHPGSDLAEESKVSDSEDSEGSGSDEDFEWESEESGPSGSLYEMSESDSDPGPTSSERESSSYSTASWSSDTSTVESDSAASLNYLLCRNRSSTNPSTLLECPSLPELSPSMFPDLPTDVLRSVFLRAIPPRFLILASLKGLPRSSALTLTTKTKLSLSMVCKSWHMVAIEFLYEDIFFRYPAQLPAFLNTIETTPPKFQHLVKSITINMFVAPHHGVSFSKYLQRIIDNSPSLKRFDILSLVTLPPTCIYPKLYGITELYITMTSPTLIHLLGTTRETLRSLLINIPYTLEEIDAAKPYVLPNLENLVVEVDSMYYDTLLVPETPSELGRNLFTLLDVSCLLRFTFKCESAARAPSFNTPLVPFLERKGHTLSYLHLEGYLNQPELVQQLLDRCPALEYLRLHITSGRIPEITHPCIKWLDRGPSDSWTLPLAQKAFSRLQDMRTIYSVEGKGPIHLPLEFVSTESDAYKLEFPGISFQNEVGRIFVDVNALFRWKWKFRRADGHDSDCIPESDRESDNEFSSDAEGETNASDRESDASLGDLEIFGFEDELVTDTDESEVEEEDDEDDGHGMLFILFGDT
ncbi:hypothetical protein H0H92_005812 [Tricholoma furcatifolium]|nr:hypothetical protein H0H92_005812 [Tricholoma furcatifolium]